MRRFARRGQGKDTARDAPDRRLLRATRARLLAWSGGSTLVALAVLGAAIYVAVAESLASASVAQLQSREQQLEAKALTVQTLEYSASVKGAQVVSVDPGKPGFVFGGESSGTLAVIIAALPSGGGTTGGAAGAGAGPAIEPGGGTGSSGASSGEAPTGIIPSFPTIAADAARTAVATGRRSITTGTLSGAPVRVLTVPVVRDGVTYVVQVAADMTAEQRTLEVLLIVLAAGGLLVLLLALGMGWVYSGRALVPIRESLHRQRDFAADASHELRTPLAVLRGTVDLVRAHPEARVADVEPALADIDAEAGRITLLVDELLLLARADSGMLEVERVPVDLADCAVDAVEALMPLAAAAGHRVELDIQPSPVLGDPVRLRQLVGILVDNALRHAAAPATVTVRPEGDRAVVLEVVDDGPGIAPADLSHVFERFYRGAATPAAGSGLGLAIARWIVERHGGSIDASNRPAGGARFRVVLPAA